MHPPLALFTLAALAWLTPANGLVAQVAFGPNLGTATWLRTEPTSTPSQTLHLDLQAAPSRVVLVGLSPTGAAQQTPWGTLWLGPGSGIRWGMVTDTAGFGQVTVSLPPIPGIEAYLQAAVLEPPYSLALSNLVRVRTGGAPLVWHEDFESYGPGTYPNGWSTAVGNSQQLVDGAVAGQGQQSFQLVGMAGSCWSAGSVRRVDPFNGLYPTDFTVEVLVRNSSFAQTGCHAWYLG